ncbi:unnamed protein product [Rotaria socialis]|uniref:EF-hand domain-containing protein n=1 Tax=Rotaria socialis TaxID=392032 RepID=A0A818SWV7_9BILA|nr:unnamed protein product [Rotaria socialis]CAF3474048.1 unnamed protein product [Rotaria socialis]CAF3678867.1 unnamed protein product [Rotaria socialis]CAF4518045.1 unnamed protein product [Rotaria socialis]CAF4760598.1 unnamed protein product [Rotaria socialis]
MSSTVTTENSPIPIAKMVNDLFLQWLSLPDTRTSLSAALNSVRTNSKMPDLIVYSKSYAARGGGFSKSQHFDSPPVSPVPRAPSSPRISSSTHFPLSESIPGPSGLNEEKRQRAPKKISTVLNGSPTSSIDQQQTSIEKQSNSKLTKYEAVPSSPSSPTNDIQNRSSTNNIITPSKDIPSKQSQQTLIPQPASNVSLDQPLKPTNASVSALRETFDNNRSSAKIIPAKTPTEQIAQPTLAPPKTTTQTAVKVEEGQNSVDIIPKFYFPDEQLAAVSTRDALISTQLRKAKDELFTTKNDKLRSEDFGKLAQLIDLSLYWKAPLFRACALDALGSKATITPNTTVSYAQFESFWKKVCKNNHDNALKFIYILIHSSTSTLSMNRQHLTVDDWDYFVQDIIDTHPGLKFLRDAREFHSRYIKTVVARVFYNCNRSWSTRLTVQELRRSNFLQTLDRLQEEEDINRIHDYFSYEHFYVIYCKFWDIDTDHDLLINRDDLAKHNGGAISNKMIDRIFSGAVSNSPNMKEGKMSYYEFVWFLISEEDKCSPTSIEYWFRCMDIDGDGILSMYELEYFYQEQVHKMEIYGIEYMPFEDCICQMLDLVKPEDENKIRLKDLKRCKLTNIFFDTFFNLEKYLVNEQKDPFSNLKDPDTPEVSDWVKYAETEYDNLTHEDGGNDDPDDGNYDEDFEDDDDGAEDSKDRKPAGSTGSASNNKSDDL